MGRRRRLNLGKAMVGIVVIAPLMLTAVDCQVGRKPSGSIRYMAEIARLKAELIQQEIRYEAKSALLRMELSRERKELSNELKKHPRDFHFDKL